MTNKANVRAFFEALRHPVAWPGGYSIRLYLTDGESICHKCAREEVFQIGRATRDGERSGWAFLGASVHWEGPPEHCVQCNEELSSEYGECERERNVEPSCE